MDFETYWQKCSDGIRRDGLYTMDAVRELCRNAFFSGAKNTGSLLEDAARKAVRVRGNGQPKQLDDAILLLDVALKSIDSERVTETPNVKSQATDAALSRQVACTDGLGLIGSKRTTA